MATRHQKKNDCWPKAKIASRPAISLLRNMTRKNLTSLKNEVIRKLNEEVLFIKIEDDLHNCMVTESPVARSEYCEAGKDRCVIKIWADAYQVNLFEAVIHEILHRMLDEIFKKYFTYKVYENFIKSLETPIFECMTRFEEFNFRKTIKSKMAKHR